MEAAASIIAVVQLADRIACACKAYIDGVEGYPKDLRVVYVEIKSLAVIFEVLQLMKQDDAQDALILSHLQGPDGPIEGCKTAAEGLSTLLSAPVQEMSSGQSKKKRKLQLSLSSLAWPLKASQAQKLMSDIARHKTTINVAMSGTIL